MPTGAGKTYAAYLGALGEAIESPLKLARVKPTERLRILYVSPLRAVIGLIDGMYALMAIPTMLSTLVLAPKVRAAATDYFARLKDER